MATNKHFLQDRTALLLVSATAFLTLAAVVLVLLKLGTGQGTYVGSYRASFGIDHFIPGTLRDMVSFIVAAVVIFGFSITLSYKAYTVKRELSLVVLALTVPLLLFLIVVSNALLVLP